MNEPDSIIQTVENKASPKVKTGHVLTHQQAAQVRASVSAFLSNHPGLHTAQEIGKAVGVSGHTAGQILGGMARNKLIPSPQLKGKKKGWTWGKPSVGAAGRAVAAANRLAKAALVTEVAKTSGPVSVAASDEVELVMGGTLLVIGTNPANGRIRIILEKP